MSQSFIFKLAWNIATMGAKKFGGKKSEYFAESLHLAYVTVKNHELYAEHNRKWRPWFRCDVRDGKIIVTTPYNSEYVKTAHENGGRWDGASWSYDEKKAPAVSQALEQIYGYSLYVSHMVTVNLKASDFYEDGKIVLNGITLAKRNKYDRRVLVSSFVNVVRGIFSGEGGTAECPKVTWKASNEPELQVYIAKTIIDGLSQTDRKKLNIKKIRRSFLR